MPPKKGKKQPKKKEEAERSSPKEKEESDSETESESTKSVSKNEKKAKIKPKQIPSSPAAAPLLDTKDEKDLTKPKSSRMLIIFRNAEQMDKVFPEWIHKSFVDGKYVPTDMNQPVSLPLRKTPLAAYDTDPPLTEIGMRVSQLMGRALTENGIVISAVYSSPSLRCIQTAQNLVKAQRSDLKICVEPAVYDFAGAKGKEIPIFMSAKELLENSIPIDKNYRPITPMTHLSKFMSETSVEFFKRQSNNIYMLTQQSPNGTVLIVTHACTMHAIGRQLIGKIRHSLSTADMLRVPFNYPYCSGIALKPSPDGRWTIGSQTLPILNSSHFSNRFNHHFFAKSSG